MPLLLSAGLSLRGCASALAQEAVPQDDNLNATLWGENSVEYKANTLAMYQLAQIRLDQALADKNWTAATEQTGAYQDLPPAMILDADETVLDNGGYEVLAGRGAQGIQRQDLGCVGRAQPRRRRCRARSTSPNTPIPKA